MSSVKTKTTYLEMFSRPTTEIPAPQAYIEISRIDLPSVEYYRRLYRGVGSNFHWVDRLSMPQLQLQEIIQDEQVEIYVLTVAGKAAGYSELDCRLHGEVELAYFGLFPEAIGQGLGKYLLYWTLLKAWSRNPKRVWVHTCDLDHCAALPNYLKLGFQIYQEVVIDQIVDPETP